MYSFEILKIYGLYRKLCQIFHKHHRMPSRLWNTIKPEQLKNPKIAKLFDSDGDGKANLTGCNPGWGMELASLI
ncbi:hypothetical protein BI334_30540 [Moorena producens 3L]|nr:hypothetical protein BI334_30540 [Moorena producens 3L]